MLTINSTDLAKIDAAIDRRASDAERTEARTLIVDCLARTTSQAMREAAADRWASDDLEIDDEASESPTDDGGTWVSAWVYVRND